jgi:hypothetical protein
VFVRRYDVAGRPLGDEFLVNSTTQGNQGSPSVTADADGSFVVSWVGEGPDAWGVYAQVFDSGGGRQGGELRVSPATDSSVGAPAVAMDDDGDFVVAWQTEGQDTDIDDYDVYARRYDAGGRPAGDPFRVNTTIIEPPAPPALPLAAPAVSMGADGDFVVTWVRAAQSTEGELSRALVARQFTAAGQPAGGEVVLHTTTNYVYPDHSVASGPFGDSVVTWAEGGTVYARRFNAARNTVGNRMFVGTGDQPSVAMDEDGDFVIAWSEYQPSGCGSGSGGVESGCYGSYVGVSARRYSASGEARGDPFRVTPTVGSATAAMDDRGDVLVVWSGSGIFGRHYGDTPAPRVTQVFVGGSGWSPDFRASVEAGALGESGFGYALVGFVYGVAPLPWANLDQISARFSEPVAASARDLSVAGLSLGDYPVRDFAYDPATNTATWTLARPLGNDRALLDLNGDDDGVIGANRLRLDGERTDYPFASGDGSPGGDFTLNLSTLPGDVTRDGRVNALDVADVRRRLNSTATRNAGAGYSPFADVNGDGAINARDLSAVRRRLNRAPPAARTAAMSPPRAALAPDPPPRDSATKELFASVPIVGEST